MKVVGLWVSSKLHEIERVTVMWPLFGVLSACPPARTHVGRRRINGGLRAPTREHPRYMSNYEVAIRTAGSP